MSELLLKLSGKYNREIDNVVKNIGTAIEPIVIIAVGLIV
jgi:type II secretory pathway component PulF